MTNPARGGERMAGGAGEEASSASTCVVVDTKAVDDVVQHINVLARASSLEFALGVGALIIHHLYGGETNAWRARGPKTVSFRSLSKHPALPLSSGALYRCVALFELCDRLKVQSRWPELGASHLRSVLGLESQTQEQLLTSAAEQHWTVKELEQHAAKEDRARLTSGGRRAERPLAKSLKKIRQAIESDIDVDGMRHLPCGDAGAIVRMIEETKNTLERLRTALLAAMVREPALDASRA